MGKLVKDSGSIESKQSLEERMLAPDEYQPKTGYEGYKPLAYMWAAGITGVTTFAMTLDPYISGAAALATPYAINKLSNLDTRIRATQWKKK